MIAAVFFFQAEDGIRDVAVTGVQTCALPIFGVADVSGARNPDYLIVELTLWCVTVSRAAGNRTSGEQCPLGLFRAARELLQTPFRRRQNSPFACKPSLCGSGHRAERDQALLHDGER